MVWLESRRPSGTVWIAGLNTFPPVGWLVREGEGKQKSTRRSCFPAKAGGVSLSAARTETQDPASFLKRGH